MVPTHESLDDKTDAWILDILRFYIQKASLHYIEKEDKDVGYGFNLKFTAPRYTQIVDSVVEGSPAAKANVFPGQFIMQINGKNVIFDKYQAIVQLIKASGDRLFFLALDPMYTGDFLTHLNKHGVTIEKRFVNFLEFQNPIAIDKYFPFGYYKENSSYGIRQVTLNRTSAFDGYGFSVHTKHMIITLVEANSPAEKAGLNLYDKIVFIHGIPTEEMDHLDLVKNINQDKDSIVFSIADLESQQYFSYFNFSFKDWCGYRKCYSSKTHFDRKIEHDSDHFKLIYEYITEVESIKAKKDNDDRLDIDKVADSHVVGSGIVNGGLDVESEKLTCKVMNEDESEDNDINAENEYVNDTTVTIREHVSDSICKDVEIQTDDSLTNHSLSTYNDSINGKNNVEENDVHPIALKRKDVGEVGTISDSAVASVVGELASSNTKTNSNNGMIASDTLTASTSSNIDNDSNPSISKKLFITKKNGKTFDAKKYNLRSVQLTRTDGSYGFELVFNHDKWIERIGAVDSNSTAKCCKLVTGDYIIGVNGKVIDNLDHNQVVSNIGENRESVELLIADQKLFERAKSFKYTLDYSFPNIINYSCPKVGCVHYENSQEEESVPDTAMGSEDAPTRKEPKSLSEIEDAIRLYKIGTNKKNFFRKGYNVNDL